MQANLTALAAIILLPCAAQAGEVFGTVKTERGPVGEGAQVAAKCGDQVYGPATTDKRGSYRLVIEQTGKCTLSVTHGSKTATLDVVSFDSAAQTDVALKVDAAGKLTASRG
jgi:hypothetical protein